MAAFEAVFPEAAFPCIWGGLQLQWSRPRRYPTHEGCSRRVARETIG